MGAAEITDNYSHENDESYLEGEIADFNALSEDIEKSVESKNFKLTKDYINSNGNYTDGISVNIDDLVIDGQGHTIDANKKSRVFKINARNVVLKNISIVNGNFDNHGGGIYWLGENGTVDSSVFINCNSSKSGGAVFFKNTATLTNSVFKDNKAYFGGAVDFEEICIISNSKFSNNSATFLGGGVFCFDFGEFLNTLFEDNIAGDGGGIYFSKTGIVNKSVFNYNYAIGYGGAIISDSNVVISNSTFFNNYGKFGGVLYFKDSGVVDKSIFRNNRAESGGVISGVENVAVNHSIFVNNSATTTGGAVSYTGKSISINNSEFTYNDANTSNSIYISSNSAEVVNCVFNNLVSTYDSEIYVNAKKSSINNLSFNNVTLPVEENTSQVNVVVNNTKNILIKIKTTIKAKSATFKASLKTKKYTVYLKSSKAISNKKLKLKIKGKTFTAKTNRKGKAVFKIKLNKKGKFKSKISFAGDNLFNSCKKQVLIKIY